MATAPNEIDDIRRQMARIRRELHEDVRDVVKGAEAVSDWRHYMRMYPWATVVAAAAIGYFVVPKRRKPAIKAAEVAQAVAAVMPQMVLPTHAASPKPSKGLIRGALGLLTPIALRAAQNYATHFASNWIAQQQAQMAAAGMAPHPESPSPGVTMPGGPSRPVQAGRGDGSRI